MYGWRGKIGHVSPSRGDTMVHEFYLIAPEGMMFLNTTGQIRQLDKQDFQKQYEHLEWAAKDLVEAGANLVLLGGGPIFSGKGYEKAREICLHLEDELGVPVQTTICAAVEAMKNLSIKLINGYGGQEQDIAMMRGEIDGQIGTYSSMQSLLDNKEAIAVLSIGKKLDNIPNLRDIAPVDKKPLVDLEESQAQLSRLIAATPGIPEGRVLALREALQKAFADPELLEKAKTAKLTIDFMDGEETGKLVSSALNQTPEMKTLIKEIVTGK